MPLSNSAHRATKLPWAKLLSLCSGAQKLKLLSPCAATMIPELVGARALPQEKTLEREAQAPNLESSPCLPQLEKSLCNYEDPAQPKVNK